VKINISPVLLSGKHSNEEQESEYWQTHFAQFETALMQKRHLVKIVI